MKNFVRAFLLASTTLCAAQVSLADLPEGLHYMVSPPSCQPASDADRDRLRMVNGVWVFRSNVADVTAHLFCPVNFYGNVGVFNNIQLWYKDDFEEHPQSGFAHFGYVEAILKARLREDSGWVEIDRVDSNSGPQGYGFVNNFGISGGPETGEGYFVDVVMWREYATGDVAFAGLAIDIR